MGPRRGQTIRLSGVPKLRKRFSTPQEYYNCRGEDDDRITNDRVAHLKTGTATRKNISSRITRGVKKDDREH